MTQEKSSLILLDPQSSDEPFPPVEMAWEEPNGLLAFGGCLSPTRLINAYKSGIFPWYNPDEPIYWWSPNPRAVLFPNKIKLTRSLRKSIRNKGYVITIDRDFRQVVDKCAAPRISAGGTWITTEMALAYEKLHKMRLAHSVEVWNENNTLVGGLYGVATGGVFSGESMFSTESDTSKIAFIALAWHMQHWGYSLIDCQIGNGHLMSMGAENISRKEYLTILKSSREFSHDNWEFNQEAELSRWQS